jgi:hypothetical protein
MVSGFVCSFGVLGLCVPDHEADGVVICDGCWCAYGHCDVLWDHTCVGVACLRVGAECVHVCVYAYSSGGLGLRRMWGVRRHGVETCVCVVV